MKEILVPIFKNGQCVYDSPSVMEIQKHCKEQLETMWEESRRLVNPQEVFVDLSGQLDAKDTTIVKEYPMPYQGKDGEIPYYAINNAENDALFLKYKELVNKIPNFYLLGRLAEYKYYNIDAIVDRALTVAEEI